ncbi:MAG TPA: murein L,D-transpeptidase catalytic domain family protein [Mucilaginibacter sp.]|nr:murein L,D-transpeptidase catalytic domain family protein [Mucilaginibacter sp.]
MKKRYWVTCILLSFSITAISWKAESNDGLTKITSPLNGTIDNKTAKAPSAEELFGQYLESVYNTAQLSQSGLDIDVFEKAVTGFFNLKAAGDIPQYSSVIAIADLAKSSCTKRLWIIDLIGQKLLLNTWVAHGSGSGDDVASNFSNEYDSHASSLGFYVTGGVYYGKHGRSLKLDGMDAGFNDNARERAIVIHAAPYVSKSSINKLGRLGRSEGCPAVSRKVIAKVISMIRDKSVLFISGNDSGYTSKYLDKDIAANYVYPGIEGNPALNASL